jgi:hypothetical protein
LTQALTQLIAEHCANNVSTAARRVRHLSRIGRLG